MQFFVDLSARFVCCTKAWIDDDSGKNRPRFPIDEVTNGRRADTEKEITHLEDHHVVRLQISLLGLRLSFDFASVILSAGVKEISVVFLMMPGRITAFISMLRSYFVHSTHSSCRCSSDSGRSFSRAF